MRKLFLVLLLAFCAAPAFAQTQKTRAALITEINTNFADNTTGAITPALARATYNDMISSTAMIADTAPGDAAYPMVSTDRYVRTTALSAARVWTLPAANSLNKGEAIIVADAAGVITSANTISVARAGADTIGGGSASIVLQTPKMNAIFITDGVSNWGFGFIPGSDPSSATNLVSGTLPTARLSLGQLTNSLGGNVALNNVTNYFIGPTVSQGSTGTWFAAATVTLSDTVAATFDCKLWDGTTVISSAETRGTANLAVTISLSGFLATPGGNLRVECKDTTSVNGLIVNNLSGNSKDSTITVFRIN